MRGFPHHDPVLVSAVVPAFNAAATIDAAILSIRRQTHIRMEIIIVDDGSADRTGEIARSHAAEDDRIRTIEIPNGGVAAARNAGIRAARADLIAPIDADDLRHPDKITRQLDVMRRGGPSIGYVYSGFNQIDMEDGVIRGGGLRRPVGASIPAVDLREFRWQWQFAADPARGARADRRLQFLTAPLSDVSTWWRDLGV